MIKKAIIFDLDNTIYPVRSIAHSLFEPLYELIERDKTHAGDKGMIKKELMRRPFQLVAKKYGFQEELVKEGTDILRQLVYKGPIEPYPDYHFARQLPLDKYLVTSGFEKLQRSKIDGLRIADDFKEIHIVDMSVPGNSKKIVFADIMQRFHLKASELLVVGDDLESEIKAAIDLGIEGVLYDHENVQTSVTGVKKIRSMEELTDLFK